MGRLLNETGDSTNASFNDTPMITNYFTS